MPKAKVWSSKTNDSLLLITYDISKEMKKFLLSLLPIVALMVFATSCDDDKDLPNVEISFTFDNARSDNGTVYVVQGDTLHLDGITVTSLDKGKEAGISAFPRFYLNGVPAPLFNISYTTPFSFDMEMDIPVSSEPYTLSMIANVFEVDKTIATAQCNIPIMVVATEEDIPDDAVNNTVKPDTKVSDSAVTPQSK